VDADHQHEPQITQLIQSGDYLIWLDAEARAVYRVRKTVASKTPSAQQPAEGERETLWAGEPLAKPAGIAADKAGVIYITDKHTESIYSLKPGGGISVFFSGKPMHDPAAVAVSDDGVVYVTDAHAKKLFSFDPVRKEIVAEYDFADDRVTDAHAKKLNSVAPVRKEMVPDRLLFGSGMLLAVDRESRMLYRFITEKAEHPADESPNAEWKYSDSGGHATVGRGMVTDLGKTVEELSDVCTDSGVVYLLDSQNSVLVLIPLGGGPTSSLPSKLLAENPMVLASDGDSIYFAEGEAGKFRRAPALSPLTLYFIGDWTAPDVVALYTYLHGIGMLPVKEYTADRPVSLEELTLSQNIMPTGYVDDFQVLFCEINPTLCTVEQRRPLRGEQAPPPGYAVRFNPGSRFLLPALPVTSSVARRNIKLPLDPKIYKPEDFRQFFNSPLGSIARELAPRTLGDSQLKALLDKYNPLYKGEDILSETEGSFGVPVSAGSMRVVVPSAELLNPNSGISRLAAKKNISGFSPARPLQPQSGYMAAKGGLIPAFNVEDCRPPDTTNAARTQIGYCRPTQLARQPAVGIIDNIFNENHPAFAEPALGGHSALRVYRAPNSTEESRPAEVERPNPNSFVTDLDHGTHIAGIIGARPQSGEPGGLLPQASLYGLTVDNLTQMQEDDEWSKLRIFNVSLGERRTAQGGQPEPFSGTDVIKEFMANNNHTLFVVAAGNEGRPVQNKSLAWMGYLDNVIVVGATNVPEATTNADAPSAITLLRMPDGSGSNFDSARMPLVAPGERIRSTLYNGQYGEASGTSQATAFVTAAAATLMAAQPSWDAWQVKFRLIATADLWTASNMSNSVFAGELNFRRAMLDSEKATIEREDGGVCTGEVAPTSLGLSLVIRRGSSNISIPFSQILRVRRNRTTSTDYTIIYYVENPPDDYPDRVNRYLHREVNVSANQMRMNYKFTFIPTVPSASCQSGEVNLKELVDFINSVNP
jgi:sugar lactone lactonase YvrE